MFVNQLSVFIENKPGTLTEILNTLSNAGVDLVALSLADTVDFGILRLIVSDPQAGQDALRANGFSAQVTKVIAVKLQHEKGALSNVTKLFGDKVSIEYLYAVASGGTASIVMKCDNMELGLEILKENNVELWDAETVYYMNKA